MSGGTVSTVAPVRYRCTACGNLTRFDVTTTRRARAFHHYSLGGDLAVEEEQVLAETVEEVSCRWCGSGRAVEAVADTPQELAAAPQPAMLDAGAPPEVATRAPGPPQGSEG